MVAAGVGTLLVILVKLTLHLGIVLWRLVQFLMIALVMLATSLVSALLKSSWLREMIPGKFTLLGAFVVSVVVMLLMMPPVGLSALLFLRMLTLLWASPLTSS